MKTLSTEQIEALNALNGVFNANLSEDVLTKLLKATAGIDINTVDQLPDGILRDYSGLSRKQQIIAKHTLVVKILPLKDTFLNKQSEDGEQHLRRHEGSQYMGVTDNALKSFETDENGEYVGERGESKFFYAEISSKIRSFNGETKRNMIIFDNFPIFETLKESVDKNVYELDLAGQFVPKQEFCLFKQGDQSVYGRPIQFGHEQLKDEKGNIVAEEVGETWEECRNRYIKRNNNTRMIISTKKDEAFEEDEEGENIINKRRRTLLEKQ